MLKNYVGYKKKSEQNAKKRGELPTIIQKQNFNYSRQQSRIHCDTSESQMWREKQTSKNTNKSVICHQKR